jgi:hypothetical protein
MNNILNIRLADRKWTQGRSMQTPGANLQSFSASCFSVLFICGIGRSCSAMTTSVDTYVQITASSQSSGKSRSVIVLVPRANIENFRRQKSDSKSDDHSIAKILAEPLAGYAFTHRTIFSAFELSHSFLTTPPSEIEGRSPNLSQSGLKAWVI